MTSIDKKRALDWDRYVEVRYAAVDNGVLQRAYDEFVSPFSDTRPETVLDVGVGPGAHLAAIADRVPGAQLFGFDVDAVRVERANSELSKRGIDAELAVGNAPVLPYPDASFDVVMAHLTMPYANNDKRFLAECCRVLRAGGLFWFSTHGIGFFVRKIRKGALYPKLRWTGSIVSGLVSMSTGLKPLADTPVTAAWLRRALEGSGTVVLRLDGPRLGPFYEIINAVVRKRV